MMMENKFWLGIGIGIAGTAALSLGCLFWRKKKQRAPKRVGGICRLRPEKFDQYTQLHDHTWDEVMERMYKSNIRNFVVYLHKETMLMFSHFEYVGNDFEKDMAEIDKDPIVRKWWSYCEPCQSPFHWDGPPPSQGGSGGKNGAWWDPLVCLNHCGAWPIEYSSAWPDPDFVPQNPHGKLSDSSNPPSTK